MKVGIDMSDSLPVDHSINTVRTDILDIGYLEFGPKAGQPVILLHGFPYDVHSFHEVAPQIAGYGHRVLVPYLRGHGPTRFRSDTAHRSGEQAALGSDVIDLMDALGIPRAVLAGFDWGGRAACVAAALWPDRVTGLVSVNSYLIQDIGSAMTPLPAEFEAGLWYFFYFLTERGRRGLTENRRGVADVIWRRNSPEWQFDEETLDQVAKSFTNPDFVDVVIHSYRHRLGAAPGSPTYGAAQRRLAALPAISVPTVTLDGLADGNFPATDGSTTAHKFTGLRRHHRIPHAGHNLPQEAPTEFTDAVLEVLHLAMRMEQTA